MTEAQLTQKVRNLHKKYGICLTKYFSNMYTGKGTPDFIDCYPDGTAFFLELKAGKYEPSAQQLTYLKKRASNNAFAIILCTDDWKHIKKYRKLKYNVFTLSEYEQKLKSMV